ncbi:MAG: 1-acyl-sn-glycerol-3-phosphate acyltransferase [Candidatus Hydrogenedentota bacterium]|nr:MAG: 1-acyl-sn-glycerol-3-phosphate acyltransferase [Candidatus Hydrogenedentota bacterium]
MKSDAVIKAYPEEIMKPVPEWYWDLVARRFVKPLVVRMKIRQQVEGPENLRQAVESGIPVFIFSNHLSWADHFLIMNMIDDCIQTPVAALCKEKYYGYPVFRWFLRKTNQIPLTNVKLCFGRWYRRTMGRLPRERDFIEFMNTEGGNLYHEVNVLKRQSLVRTAVYTHEMVQRKRPILGYPEGTRSQRGLLQPIKTGIMQLPFECKGIVLPIAISGTDRILPKGVKWYNIFKYYKSAGALTKAKFGRGIGYSELLDKCQEKFERIEDVVNLENVKILRELIEKDQFRAYTAEAERFERVFDESSLIVMRAVNEMLPEEYRTGQVEIKYPR